MSWAKRSKNKARYRSVPDKVLNSASFAKLTGNATKLLLRILTNYNGHNNGNLTSTWQEMKSYFNSQDTIRRALADLLTNEVLEITGTGTTSRKGGKPPTLYAITWEPIDEYKGKGVMTAAPTSKPIREHWPKANGSKSPSPKTGAKPPKLTPVAGANISPDAKSSHPNQVRAQQADNEPNYNFNNKLERNSG